MKFLFFTDTHIRGTTPRNRRDNFPETLKSKFREIGQIIEEHEVDYVLHGGDWFDRPDIAPAIVREFAVIVKNYNKPVYTIAGNHDIYGHNPETVGRTMLGLLEGLGVITLLGYNDTILLEKKGIKVQLTGKPFRYDIDGEDYKAFYSIKKQEGIDYAINMVHGMLLFKPFFEGIQYTLIEDIKDTEADVTLAGHYHSGFGIRQANGRYFVNPGSLVRVANTLSEIKRKPSVVLIDCGDKLSVSEIELKSALPGEEVLDRTQVEAAQDKSMKLQEFYQGITRAGEFKRIDLNEIIEEIASNQELSREVKDETVRRIAVAREYLKSGDEDE